MNKWILNIILLFFVTVSFTTEQNATETESSGKPKPVEKAPKVKPGYVPRPEITITEGKDKLVKEYHIDGKLRAIKVTPKNGFPAYYLIDREGTGEFVKLGPDIGPNQRIPQWILFEW